MPNCSESLLRDDERLLGYLTEHGGEANNGTISKDLGWDKQYFWLVRNRLLDRVLVQKQRGGPGGSTALAQPAVSIPDRTMQPQTANDLPAPESEADLYEPMLSQIRSEWIRDEGYDSAIARKTAIAGRRLTGGKWTRPDVCVVAVQKFKFLRDPVFDVISFEIKPNWAVTVEGVFEALAHRQNTTRAYVVYHVSNEDFSRIPEADRIVALAEQHGIGVFLAGLPADYDTWTEKVRGRRWIPDPSDLNEFLQRIFPDADHDEIIKLAK